MDPAKRADCDQLLSSSLFESIPSSEFEVDKEREREKPDTSCLQAPAESPSQLPAAPGAKGSFLYGGAANKAQKRFPAKQLPSFMPKTDKALDKATRPGVCYLLDLYLPLHVHYMFPQSSNHLYSLDIEMHYMQVTLLSCQSFSCFPHNCGFLSGVMRGIILI